MFTGQSLSVSSVHEGGGGIAIGPQVAIYSPCGSNLVP